MSVYLPPRKKQLQNIAQKQGCAQCQKGNHYLCTRRRFLGMSSNGSPVRDCCCGGQPSKTVKFQGSDKAIRKAAAKSVMDRHRKVTGRPLSSELEKAIKEWAETDAKLKKEGEALRKD